MKRREVNTSPAARADLRNIYSLIADAGSPVNGLRFVERIAAFCEKMDIASERGTRRDDLRPGLRVVGFERRVSIAIMVDDASGHLAHLLRRSRLGTGLPMTAPFEIAQSGFLPAASVAATFAGFCS